MTEPSEITENTRDMLDTHRDHRITFARATLRAVGDRFVMEGPSGRHSLLIIATDAERLNAHWRTFASHPANAAEQDVKQ